MAPVLSVAKPQEQTSSAVWLSRNTTLPSAGRSGPKTERFIRLYENKISPSPGDTTAPGPCFIRPAAACVVGLRKHKADSFFRVLRGWDLSPERADSFLTCHPPCCAAGL
ncbi:unnamed protein product [Gadus morhua 'NCC']